MSKQIWFLGIVGICTLFGGCTAETGQQFSESSDAVVGATCNRLDVQQCSEVCLDSAVAWTQSRVPAALDWQDELFTCSRSVVEKRDATFRSLVANGYSNEAGELQQFLFGICLYNQHADRIHPINLGTNVFQLLEAAISTACTWMPDSRASQTNACQMERRSEYHADKLASLEITVDSYIEILTVMLESKKAGWLITPFLRAIQDISLTEAAQRTGWFRTNYYVIAEHGINRLNQCETNCNSCTVAP